LAAAKTYIQVEGPSVNLVVLDAQPSIGGTWATHRLYPGLKSNNILGTYEYTDFPMAGFAGAKEGQHIPGEVINAYLAAYAERFDVARRIRFNTNVVTVTRVQDDHWLLETETGSKIQCAKLMVATGLISEAFVPTIKGSEAFGQPLFHCKELHERSAPLLTSGIKNVTILGGNKSAYDTVYLFASQGIHVDWIIRKSGHGPTWMAPPYVTPFKRRIEFLVMMRFLTWFSPCIWGDADGFGWIRGWLHGTSVGRWIVDKFWGVLEGDVIQLNGWDDHPKTAKLKPWIGAFWTATSLSIFNYPTNILELIRSDLVDVHVADITHLSPKTVHLSTGDDLASDAMIYSTGWRFLPPIKFQPEGIDRVLGLPYQSPDVDPLVAKADQEILTRFPRLARQPTGNPALTPMPGDDRVDINHPFRLYRFILPPTDAFGRSIAFIGMMHNINTSLTAEIHSLYAVAYLTGGLVLDKKTAAERRESGISFDEERTWETALTTRFGRWRYPGGFGMRYPDFVFDAVPYFDVLLKDLGVNSRRKGNWLKECFEGYSVSDYDGIVREWMTVRAKAL